jgi:hypothetical protein
MADLACVAVEQRGQGGLFDDYASAFNVFLIFANAPWVRRSSQAAIKTAASASISALHSITCAGRSHTQTGKKSYGGAHWVLLGRPRKF